MPSALVQSGRTIAVTIGGSKQKFVWESLHSVTKIPWFCHISAIGAAQTTGMELLYALQKFDLRLFVKVFRQGERRAIRPLAKALSQSGDGYLHILLPVLLWLLSAPQLQQFAYLLLLSLTMERSLYFILKNSLKRRRPQEYMPGFRSLIVASDQFSFPSGHSSGAFLLATALAVIYAGPLLVVYLWACCVGFSRVILGVHFPGDILAGATMGTTITLLSARLLGIT